MAKNQKCSCCGSLKSTVTGYYISYSPMFASNEKRMNICKDCVIDIYERYVDFYGDEVKALYRITLLFDGYFSSSLVEVLMAQAKKTNTSLVRVYFQKVNSMPQFKGKTSLDSEVMSLEDGSIYSDISSNENTNDIEVEDDFMVTSEMVRRWGRGLPKDDYAYLEEKYQELVAVYDHRNPVQRMLYENISRTQLEAEKSRRSGNLQMYEKMMSTLSKLMGDGNIKPVQENSVSDDEASFGLFIKKIEDEEPIPEPLDEFKDIDGFRKYINEWFVKPFARIFDLDMGNTREEEVHEDEN